MLVAKVLSCHTHGTVDAAVQLAAATAPTVSPPAVSAPVFGIPFNAGISMRPMYSFEPPAGVPVPLPLAIQRLPLGSTKRPFELYWPRPVMRVTGVVTVTAGAAYGISNRVKGLAWLT